MNNRLSGLPEIISFAMPGGDEEAALDGSTDSYLAEKNKPESFTRGFRAFCSFGSL
jgi:hypothetical protein